MNRLQKKCFIASTGLHLLLPVVFLAGSGFLSSRPKVDDAPINNFIAAATVDEALSGGGDNTVKSPPAALVAPPEPVAPPAPVAPPVAERTPPVETVQPPTPRDTPRDTPKAVKPVRPDPVAESSTHTHKIEVSTKLVVSSNAAVKAARDAARAKAAAEQRRAELALGKTIAGIRGGVSGSTEIRLSGPGGGGVPYANFLSAVKKVYWDAWSVPSDAPDLTVRASVTIARDGTVVSSRIIDGCGNASVDSSVQATLDRVKFAAPLPESAKEDQRTVTINFNTEAKLTG
jgi:TonB family protein